MANPALLWAMSIHESVWQALETHQLEVHFGTTPLHEALRQGDAPAATLLLADAPEVARVLAGIKQQLPLHLAAAGGHGELVELLLRAAPGTLSAPDTLGYTALHHAAEAGKEEVVAQLLAAGAAASQQAGSSRYLPLHSAAFGGHAAVIQQLLEAAPEGLFSKNSTGNTPLSLALRGGHVEAARCLVRAAPAVQPTLADLGGTPNRYLAFLDQTVPKQAALLLFADLAERLPLTEAQWREVAAPCPDLARALPSVLARSAAEAGWLVARLADWQRERLRMAALCLHRVTPLPAGVMAIILAMSLAVA